VARTNVKGSQVEDGIRLITDYRIQDIRKLIDETLASSEVMQDDDIIKLSVRPLTKYAITLHLIYDSGTTPDLDISLVAPSGSTGGYTKQASTGSPLISFGNQLNFAGSGASKMAFVNGVLIVGATAGDLQLQWAQATSDVGNTTVKAGTVLILREID